jgi:predicted transposase YdaD
MTRKNKVISSAKQLVTETKQETISRSEQVLILDLIETIIVYKLPQLGREEIKQMLGLTDMDIKETKFYQDVFTEGRQEGEMELLLSLINRRLGNVSPSLKERLGRLNVSQKLDLAEATFGFTTIDDLESWLSNNPI